MWFFSLNGVAYVMYTLLSGEWRDLAPNRRSFAEAIEVTLHDLGLRKNHLPQGKFNGAQRLAYKGVILMGAGSLLTGLAIYKPTQLHVITALLGSYEMARWLHFWLTIAFVGFFLVHVAQVIRAGWNSFRAMIIGYQILPAESAERNEVPMDKTSRRAERDPEAEIPLPARRVFLISVTAPAAGRRLLPRSEQHPTSHPPNYSPQL